MKNTPQTKFLRPSIISALFCFSALALGLAAAQSRQEIKLTQGTNIAVALSPDGKTLVFDLQGTLWRMPATGGKATAITDEFNDARQPAWSPDGKRLAFQSYRDGNFHLWTVAPDGKQLTQLTSGTFDDREPHWSPDGKRLAFASDRGGNYDIWTLEPASGKLEQLTRDTANDYNPAWSPDGKQIAFVSERNAGRGLWLWQVENRQESLLSKSNATLAAPSWSADGQQVLFQSGERTSGKAELWAKAVGSEEQPRVLSAAAEDVFPFRAAWLSASEFLYTADGQIKRANLNSAQRTTQAFEATVKLNRPAYARKKRDFDSTAPRRVLGIYAPAVSPDGQRVAFTALGDLWLAEMGKPPERLTNDVFVQTHPRWSPDGTKLIYIADNQGAMDVWQRDLKTGAERLLADPPLDANLPVLSPDGKRIAFFAGLALGATLQVFDIESGKTKAVLNRSIQATTLSWTPDGKALAVPILHPHSTRYREGFYQVDVIPVDGPVDGSAGYSLAPNPERTLSYGTLAPDGRTLAYVEDGRLSVVALNEQGRLAGMPRRVNADLADWLSWTGDSKSVVYQSLDRIKKVSLDTGRVEEFNTLIEWQPAQPTGTLVIHAGRMFDGKSSDYQRNVDVIIEGNRIKEIVAHNDARHTGNVIDASDKTVMPGLFEMHGHQSLTLGEKLGRTWLAFGITSVREPGTDPYDGAERREAWAAGQRPGPRNFFSGRLLDGNRVYYSIAEGVATEAHLDLVLQRARVLEYDLIKTYVRMPDLWQKKIAATAHQMGVPTSSHELWPAASYGMDAVEHQSATSRRGYSPKLSLIGRGYDDVVQILAQTKMNYTPTLILSGLSYQLAEQPELLTNKQFVALNGEAGVQALQARAAAGRSPVMHDLVATQGQVSLAVLKAGGRVTAGTDSPIIPYGFSLQLELQMFVRAGFTPAEAIRSATLWSAEAVGVGNDLGSVERGKLADLVIVAGDPLKNIADTLNVAVTIKNGRAYTLQALLTQPR
ncbi:MAG: PD40 domain-containing protein [Acidobacteria bacterium]|nr:PD40 domain-containing protein [Acidobacteriota bacterium]MBI3424515.1 PD40 domain-containing protein [Acidobacteriota bacterium]